jgi:hypothetical protein
MKWPEGQPETSTWSAHVRGLAVEVTVWIVLSIMLALMVALAGFVLFRMLVGRMSMLLRAVGEAAMRGEVPDVPGEKDLQIPGLGRIAEFREISELVDHLALIWKAEAEVHLGQRVLALLRGSSDPISGTLVEATDDGILLETAGGQVPVSYRRIMAIEAQSLAGGSA